MPIDYKKYPPNWKTEIRPAILQRANNKCEDCGVPNGGTMFSARLGGRTWWFAEKPSYIATRQIKVVLTIAHLDHDETNHNVKLERLKAMCQLCHLRYDADEKRRRRAKNHN